jgi:uncharacterized membrane protein YidH (DUF202 family)
MMGGYAGDSYTIVSDKERTILAWIFGSLAVGFLLFVVGCAVFGK